MSNFICGEHCGSLHVVFTLIIPSLSNRLYFRKIECAVTKTLETVLNCTKDKGIIPFKGYWQYRQCVKGKPYSTGIKLYVLADATGFIYNNILSSGLAAFFFFGGCVTLISWDGVASTNVIIANANCIMISLS